MWFLAQAVSDNTQSIEAVSTATALVVTLFMALVVTVLVVVLIAAYWKIFTKAGEAGWKSIIPILNNYVIIKIVGRPGWWLLLLFVPIANIIVSIILALDLAKAFGKDALFAILGLIIFSPIGYLMLAFGKAQYVLGGVTAAAPVMPAAPEVTMPTNTTIPPAPMA